MKVFDHHFSDERVNAKSRPDAGQRPPRDSEAEVRRKISEFTNEAHRVELSPKRPSSIDGEPKANEGDISSVQSPDQVAQKLKQSFQHGLVNFSGREKEVL